MNLKGYFDGGCWGNPYGKTGYGWVVSDDGYFNAHGFGYLGKGDRMSNNSGEYMGLFRMLEYLKSKGMTKERIVVHGDSKLVVMQMDGHWRVKDGIYVWAFQKAYLMSKEFKNLKFKWVPRYKNVYADSLSSRAIREESKDTIIEKPVEESEVKALC